ncbi:MAG: hypothetical protein GC160_08575 [Acidobacteria bacterium]|nr:hypothetical protein [Acidobacteriota bacterium]
MPRLHPLLRFAHWAATGPAWPWLALILLGAGLARAATVERVTLSTPFFFYEQNIGQEVDPEVLVVVHGDPIYAAITRREFRLFTKQGHLAIRRFAADDAEPTVQPMDRWPGRVNRFQGPPSAWLRDIPAYRQVEIQGIATGVDLVLGERDSAILLTFVVHPGGDPKMVRLRPVATGSPYSAAAPVSTVAAYQWIDGVQTTVDVDFVHPWTGEFDVALGSYDPSASVFVEMTTKSESRSFQPAYTAADASGHLYSARPFSSPVVCGEISDDVLDFCSDVHVAGADAEGNPLFSTVLGGAFRDRAAVVHPDANGGLAVVGTTSSEDFPVTPHAWQSTNAGPIGDGPPHAPKFGDLFLARLDATTGDLLYSTFYGGPADEREGRTSWRDEAGMFVLVVVEDGFPTTQGAWLNPQACPDCSAILRFDLVGGSPVYSTMVPGSLRTLSAHSDGSVYAGGSASSDVPVTPGAIRSERGQRAAYLFRLGPDGSGPIWATYYGGPGPTGNEVSDIVANAEGGAWVHGLWDLGPSLTGEARFFRYLSRFTAQGSEITRTDVPAEGNHSLLKGPGDGVWLHLFTGSSRWPTTPDALAPLGCGPWTSHLYLMRFQPNGALTFASYLHPLSSSTQYRPFVDTRGGFHRAVEGVVERLGTEEPTVANLACAAHAASRSNNMRLSPGGLIMLVGTQMGPAVGVSAAVTNNRYPTELAGVRVRIGGQFAPLLYAQAGQINAVAPYSLTPGQSADVEVEYLGTRLPPLTLPVVKYDFALFSQDPEGKGSAVAFHGDGSLNSPDHPAGPGSIVVLYGAGAGVTSRPSGDGEIANGAAELAAQVRVSYSPDPIKVLHAGPAPGLVNAVTQIIVRLPLRIDRPGIVNRFEFDRDTFISPAGISVR